MNRVLIVPTDGNQVPTWNLEGFRLERADSEADALAKLTADSYDAAVVIAGRGGGQAEGLAAELEGALGADVLPMVLAADGRLAEAASSLGAHAFDAFVDLAWGPGLVRQSLLLAINRVRTGRAVAAMQQQVLSSVRAELATLRDLSLRDAVSGLHNLRHFDEVLAREHLRCQRHRSTYALVLFDVDALRSINARGGFETGTRALARVGLALSSTTRRSDYAFRIGGDEFAALLCDADLATAQQLARRISGILRRCALTEGELRLAITISAGIARFPDDGNTADAVLKAAQAALAGAKATGCERGAACGGAEAKGGVA